ncbi:MAG TPA: tol-pal system protein YbgF [Vicinamibacterales bacterium]|nr:tol-pal system protein YbgF [Vicinamibacterales bacterium]
MKRTRAALVGLTALVLLMPAPASAAANKEHAQLMAEIRMLQEQQQQLQQMIGALADAVKGISAKMDEQTNATRKAFADQTLQTNNIAEGVRVLREKADDTSVRISQVSQELETVRQAVAQIAQTPSAAAGTGTGTETSTPANPAETGTASGAQPPATGTTAAPANPNPIPPGVSPQRMYDESWGDYTAGRFELAMQGFKTFIEAFPRALQAPSAQINIGQSLFYLNRWQEAITAYQKVISDYPQSPQVSEAYYKIGQVDERLNRLDDAKKAYQTVVTTYPNSDEAVLAKQRLEALSKK